MQVPYLIVSNGIIHYCCRMNYHDKTYCFLRDIPDYNEICGPVADNTSGKKNF
jgi:hypothetical protein